MPDRVSVPPLQVVPADSGPYGRKPRKAEKLTQATIDRVCNLIRGGNHVVTAIRVCGIDEKDFQAWIRNGRAGYRPYTKLVAQIDAALGDAEASHVAGIKQAAEVAREKGNHLPDAWLLEHGPARERWAGDDKRVTVDFATLPREELVRLADELRREVLAGLPGDVVEGPKRLGVGDARDAEVYEDTENGEG